MRAFLCSVLCVGASALTAQELVWRVEGGGGYGRGHLLARLPDMNGDGWEDMLEYAYVPDPAAYGGGRPVIAVTSGASGAMLSASPAMPVWSYNIWPWNMSVLGDMDGDGLPDYGICVYDSQSPSTFQRLEVRSSATHAIVWTATIANAWAEFYAQAITGGDFAGNGAAQVVTSATRLSPGGTLIQYDHAGNEIRRIVDPIWGVLVGVHLAPLGGDLDGDGCEDFLSAGPDYLNRGAVTVFSGKTGAVLRDSRGVQSGDKLSYATGCGDLDGDGVLDYAGGGFWGYGAVTAFSGATGLPIHTWRPALPSGLYFGIEVKSGFDLDQDGVNDLIAGQDQRMVGVMSGRDGTFLKTYMGGSPPGGSGTGGAGIGFGQVILAPPPGERYPLFVYSEREWWSYVNPPVGIMQPGLLWCYRGSPPGVRAFGAPDASTAQDVPRSGVRDVPGPGVRFTLSDAPPSMPALLVMGLSDTTYGPVPLPAPLDALGMPGLTLLASADAVGFAWTGASGMARGYAALEPNVPPGMTLSATGLPVYTQWLWFDPFDLSVGGSTAGQRFRLQ